MSEALLEARKAFNLNEIPVGAIITYNDEIIGRGHNQIESTKNPLAHAEMIAIKEALNNLQKKFLQNCSLYVTLEPCSMCAGAIVLARIENIYIGTEDEKSGACGSVFNIANDDRLNHKCNIYTGIMKDECSSILKEFFVGLRK